MRAELRSLERLEKAVESYRNRLETVLHSVESRLDKAVQSIEHRLDILEQKGNRNSWLDKDVGRPDSVSFTHLLAENVTAVVGLREAIVSRNWMIKLVWAVLFVVGTGATVYYVVKSCMEYADGPVATKINLHTSDEFKLPSLKLCLNSWMDPAKVTAQNLSKESLEYSKGYLVQRSANATTESFVWKKNFLSFMQSRNHSNLTSYFYSIAFDAELHKEAVQFPLLLSTDRVHIYNDRGNTTFGARKSYIFKEGVCYHVLLVPLSRTINMQMEGMTEIWVFLPENGGMPISKSFWTLYVEAGKGTLQPSTQESVLIIPNKTNIVTINRNSFRKLSTKEQPCNDDDGTSNMFCTKSCVSDLMAQLLGCRLLLTSQESYSIDSFCNEFDMPNLNVTQLGNETINSMMFNEFTVCNTKCSMACTNTVHQITVQTVDMQTATDGLSANISVGHIRIADLVARWQAVLEFEEVPTYSFDSLVGNVGGTLGLFFGATVFTIFQLILTVVEYFLIRNTSNDSCPT